MSDLFAGMGQLVRQKDTEIARLKAELAEAKSVRLFAFQPRGHGETSAFVMAATEEEARVAVREAAKKFGTPWCPDLDGFDGDYYDVSVLTRGEVAWNDDD